MSHPFVRRATLFGAIVAASLVMGGCGEGEEEVVEPPYLRLESPQDGAWLDEGEIVRFEIQGRTAQHAPVDVEDVIWMAEGWSADGAVVETDALPPGILDVQVSGTVEGHPLSLDFQITVWAQADTGGG
jgi:hypothetical protein